ncbi:MAG TPA: DUF1761 domain-containing protein, partial [Candidatus Cloacimonadota bacterium]|nr:DUF1761 domain-containing protein [Candidatus Cloacimonadota bacterium]
STFNIMTYPFINIWAVLISAVAFWALGALWYSPVLFGKRWQKEIGATDDELKKANMALIFGGSFLLMLFMVWALNFVINSHKAEDVSLTMGLTYGLFTGFFFSMMTMGINYLYQRRSVVLWLIDGIYVVLGLGIAGMILGAWR